MKVKLFIICVLFITLSVIGCSKKDKASDKEKVEAALFSCSDYFPAIYKDRCDSSYGCICTDKKTGVKYLLIYSGQANGGPAITRYYEK